MIYELMVWCFLAGYVKQSCPYNITTVALFSFFFFELELMYSDQHLLTNIYF